MGYATVKGDRETLLFALHIYVIYQNVIYLAHLDDRSKALFVTF